MLETEGVRRCLEEGMLFRDEVRGGVSKRVCNRGRLLEEGYVRENMFEEDVRTRGFRGRV